MPLTRGDRPSQQMTRGQCVNRVAGVEARTSGCCSLESQRYGLRDTVGALGRSFFSRGPGRTGVVRARRRSQRAFSGTTNRNRVYVYQLNEIAASDRVGLGGLTQFAFNDLAYVS